MRGVVLASVLFAVASLSGCVSLVEDDAEAQALAAEAEQALEEYVAKSGSIGGVVQTEAGRPLRTALVELLGVPSDGAGNDGLATADTTVLQTTKVGEQGEFAFIDLLPATYTVRASAAEHIPTELVLALDAGDFERPVLVLVPSPPPAYQTLHLMQAYEDLGIGATGYHACECTWEIPTDPEGLTEMVLEARLDDNAVIEATGFEYYAYSSEDGTLLAYGRGENPLHIHVATTNVPAGTPIWLEVHPDSGLEPTLQQQFEVLATLFYNGAAPADYYGLTPQ